MSRPALAAFVAGLVGVGPALAQPAPKPPPAAADLLAEVARQVVAVEPYRTTYALEMNRGYEMYLQPRRTYLGDCKSEMITFWTLGDPLRESGEPPRARQKQLGLASISTVSRYRRGARGETADCGDAREGRWTVADDDFGFWQVSRILDVVQKQLEGPGKPEFVLTCVMYDKPCANPRAQLLKVLHDGFESFSMFKHEIVATTGSANFQEPVSLRVETEGGPIAAVSLRIDVRTIS